MRKAFAVFASVAALSSLPKVASANGRFPEANAIFLSDADPDLVVLRVTFGLLISHDRGKTWDWVCERSVGSAGVEDPMYAVTPNGTYIGSTFQGLSISKDRACTFALAGGALKDTVFVDLATRKPDPKTVIALASAYDSQAKDDAGSVFFKSQLYETNDEGQSFALLAATFDPTLLSETVDLTGSDPDRIYLSAVRDPGPTPHGVLLTSHDHGKTFAENAIALEGTERGVFIAGVDPKNADRVYVRTSNGTDLPGRVLLSDDAGKTWKTIYTGTAAVLGFALSADGGKVYVGGPKDGIRAANTTDFVFEQKSTIEVQCLTFGKDGLWACSNEKSGFVAGLSSDEGATFTTKLHFCDIRGALACAPGTTTNTACASEWPKQKAALGCETPVGDAGNGADASTPPAPVAPGGGGACSCRAAPASPFGAIAAALGVAIALARRALRARTRPSPGSREPATRTSSPRRRRPHDGRN